MPGARAGTAHRSARRGPGPDGRRRPVQRALPLRTTTGRRSGRPHRIEIWFGWADGTIYLLAGGGRRSDWVRNLLAAPVVPVQIGDRAFTGHGRLIADAEEDRRARDLIFGKYAPGYGGDLTSWRDRALPVAIELGAEPGGT